VIGRKATEAIDPGPDHAVETTAITAAAELASPASAPWRESSWIPVGYKCQWT
jgi:hypothetical protein